VAGRAVAADVHSRLSSGKASRAAVDRGRVKPAKVKAVVRAKHNAKVQAVEAVVVLVVAEAVAARRLNHREAVASPR
jgi:hypothetical protein